jgi:glycosyltransferase involved in cell wall biosynthesis
MKLFYIAFESIFDPVFDSQVTEFVKELNQRLSKENEKTRLVVIGSLTDIFKKDYWKKRKKIKQALKGNCSFFFKIPYSYQIPSLFGTSLFINMVITFKVILFFLRLRRSETAVLHCRTEITSSVLIKIRDLFYPNIKVICDCRGVGSEEIIYKYPGGKGILLSKKIERVERSAHRKSDHLFCVSNSFKAYIREKNETTPDIEVVPCCINAEKFKFDEEARDKIRKEMGISDRFVILYAGSLNEWQLPEKMIEIFNIFKRNISESIFLMLTKDTEFAEDLFLDSGMDKNSYIIRHIPFDLIGKYLVAGDVGLLIREENDVNRVAFPIKFTEYIRSGVPVMTSITSDIADFIEKYDAGFRIRDHNDISEIEKIVLDIRADAHNTGSRQYKDRISSIIGEKMSWDSRMPAVMDIYRKLGTKKERSGSLSG